MNRWLTVLLCGLSAAAGAAAIYGVSRYHVGGQMERAGPNQDRLPTPPLGYSEEQVLEWEGESPVAIHTSAVIVERPYEKVYVFGSELAMRGYQTYGQEYVYFRRGRCEAYVRIFDGNAGSPSTYPLLAKRPEASWLVTSTFTISAEGGDSVLPQRVISVRRGHEDWSFTVHAPTIAINDPQKGRIVARPGFASYRILRTSVKIVQAVGHE